MARTLTILLVFAAASCGKKDGENNVTGPCGGPDTRGCVCADETAGTQTCDPETAQYDECMCASMSVESSCCLDDLYYDCPSALTANACFQNQEAGACIRDPSQDMRCSGNMNSGTNNGTNNGEPEDDPLCWANCRDGHESCAESCGGGQTCWDLCEEEHEVCAPRCGGGEPCLDRCEASPTECAGRCG